MEEEDLEFYHHDSICRTHSFNNIDQFHNMLSYTNKEKSMKILQSS